MGFEVCCPFDNQIFGNIECPYKLGNGNCDDLAIGPGNGDSWCHENIQQGLDCKECHIPATGTNQNLYITDSTLYDTFFQFQTRMKQMALDAAERGHRGWNDKHTPTHKLVLSLFKNLFSGHWADAANYCMFLWERNAIGISWNEEKDFPSRHQTAVIRSQRISKAIEYINVAMEKTRSIEPYHKLAKTHLTALKEILLDR